MGFDVWIKSLFRHFMDLWMLHRKHESLAREGLEDALCAIMFNAMGYMHEWLSKPSALGKSCGDDCGCKVIQKPELVMRNASEGL